MGYGYPAAIAAKSVHPDRDVICIAGDGDYLMTGQEIATAVQYGINVVVVVVDNGTYGTIRMHQETHYPGAARTIATDLKNPDFVKYAEAFGAFGIRCETTADFPALRPRERGPPALVHQSLGRGYRPQPHHHRPALAIRPHASCPPCSPRPPVGACATPMEPDGRWRTATTAPSSPPSRRSTTANTPTTDPADPFEGDSPRAGLEPLRPRLPAYYGAPAIRGACAGQLPAPSMTRRAWRPASCGPRRMGYECRVLRASPADRPRGSCRNTWVS
jgi:hypothetical protein